MQAVLIATAGGQLSLTARLSVALSNWFVRLLPLTLPFAMTGGIGGLALAFLAWGWVRTEPRKATLYTAVFLGTGLALAFVSTVIIVSTDVPLELVDKLVTLSGR